MNDNGPLAINSRCSATRVKKRSSTRSRHSATSGFLRRKLCLAARLCPASSLIVRYRKKLPDARKYHECGAFEVGARSAQLWSQTLCVARAVRLCELRLRVHGESMLPTLWPGDLVEIANCSPEELRTGEIVLAMREGRFFLHRLVAPCTSNGFLLRGDSMPGPDPLFPPEALVGRISGQRALRLRLVGTTCFGVAWLSDWLGFVPWECRSAISAWRAVLR